MVECEGCLARGDCPFEEMDECPYDEVKDMKRQIVDIEDLIMKIMTDYKAPKMMYLYGEY